MVFHGKVIGVMMTEPDDDPGLTVLSTRGPAISDLA